MKRVAILRKLQIGGQSEPIQQLREKLLPMLTSQAECYRYDLIPRLGEHGILLRRWQDLTEEQKVQAAAYFDNNVSAALTPLVIDPEHPFPFLSNLSTSLTFRLQDPDRAEQMFARMKIPAGLKQWVPLTAGLQPDQRLLVPLHDVIRGNIGKLYNGMKISGMTLVRIARDAEVELEEDSTAELRALVTEQIRQRRYEPVVRLEFGPGADPVIRDMLRVRFQLTPADVYDLDEEVDYTTLFEVAGLAVPQLADAPWTPLTPASLGEGTIFSAIQAGDVLVHHPYGSFEATVEHSSVLQRTIRKRWRSR